ncbi:MAG: regulatory protein RecX [Bacteroidetes bacterium]|nr:regulatory protein RecX [Bacteroidota bacterium]
MEFKKENLTPNQAKLKIANFCNYQERCQAEVKDKLYSYGLNTTDVNEVLAYTVSEGLVNEERFAILFAGGKFRQKKWGRLKIKRELKEKQISDYCIKKALLEIDDEKYIEHLESIAEKYSRTLKDKLNYIKNQKVMKHLLSKGYEMDLIQDYIKGLK